MDMVKIVKYNKVGSKWVVMAEKSEPVTLEYYNNIRNDNNAFGSGTRVTNNYCKFGRMDSKTFYNSDKTSKSVYSFK